MLTPTRLADALGQENQGITGLLDRLEQRGWVQRVRDLRDRRTIRLELTDAGAAKLAETIPPGTAALEQVFAGLAAEDIAALTAALAHIGHRAA